MKSSQFVIGIDGGGTKTAAVIADLRGDILAQHTAGPSNVQKIGVEKSARVVFSLVRDCCDSVGCLPKNIRGTTIGLAGAGRAEDQKKLPKQSENSSHRKKMR